jgi:hypothetical protein
MAGTEKLKCGDTDYCDECITRTSQSDTSGREPAYITPNAEGRCDFYMGPSETRVAPEKAY